jgi:hypothetical protein
MNTKQLMDALKRQFYVPASDVKMPVLNALLIKGEVALIQTYDGLQIYKIK